MTPDKRNAIDTIDMLAKSADLPTYSDLVDLLIQAQALIEHRGRVRNAWVEESAAVVGRIHNKKGNS